MVRMRWFEKLEGLRSPEAACVGRFWRTRSMADGTDRRASGRCAACSSFHGPEFSEDFLCEYSLEASHSPPGLSASQCRRTPSRFTLAAQEVCFEQPKLMFLPHASISQPKLNPTLPPWARIVAKTLTDRTSFRSADEPRPIPAQRGSAGRAA
jgi:hypothetical protein